MQAKQTGLFNLPGANRTQIPPILGIAGLPPPMPVQTFGMGIGSNPNLSRQSRRLYIGSITPEVNEVNLAEFFNQKMGEMGLGTTTGGSNGTGPPVLAVQCNYEKNYAFVEFRSAEDATSAMAFDGIIFINGPLKIRRPKDYGGAEIPTSTAQPIVQVPGVVSTNVPDSFNKVFVGGLPTYLNEENVMELLKSFGELRAFNLVRENGNGPSKGFAFFEYSDISITDTAIQALNGMELGDRYLVVQRASVGAKPGTPGAATGALVSNLPYDQFPEIPRPIMPATFDSDPNANATNGAANSNPGGGLGGGSGESKILLMLNMVTPEDLMDDEDYGDLYQDIKEECENFGRVEDLRIPRPVKATSKGGAGAGKWTNSTASTHSASMSGVLGIENGSATDPSSGGTATLDPLSASRIDEASGVGRVYVKYSSATSANAAMKSLAGRSFAGRSIIATVLGEDSVTTPPLAIVFAPQGGEGEPREPEGEAPRPPRE
ncbi:hypothetical protein BDP27DRAFT_426288 [Rhodocollybia butyracea]|uniref:RRM domain-containing protein n=1 Tax=Rhodocollybia butyracea TaxID=206335 RepID=A0A9P5UAR0_9AGAR|nr:hypothetical protein BDP27DRAFT_426288 [Rhodocollybia butyracea]